MIALTSLALTYKGYAFTAVVPCVIAIDTPPTVVGKGKVRGGIGSGAEGRPKTEKMEPCAMLPAGKPGDI
jgi:hypothetical protein